MNKKKTNPGNNIKFQESLKSFLRIESVSSNNRPKAFGKGCTEWSCTHGTWHTLADHEVPEKKPWRCGHYVRIPLWFCLSQWQALGTARVYWPGNLALSAAFFDELSSVLELLAIYKCPVIIRGDYNIHVDQTDNTYAACLADLLATFGCVQHVTESTHNTGHILNLIVTTATTQMCDLISEHGLVCSTLSLNKPVATSTVLSHQCDYKLLL